MKSVVIGSAVIAGVAAVATFSYLMYKKLTNVDDFIDEESEEKEEEDVYEDECDGLGEDEKDERLEEPAKEIEGDEECVAKEVLHVDPAMNPA